MDAEVKTGGPAFPGPYATENGQIEVVWKQQGMTLRDWFAGKAMQGWLSTYPTEHGADEVYAEGVAELAYEVADAMLKAREQ